MKNTLALLAAFCHGVGAAMNVLGVVYNVIQVKRGKTENTKDVLIHSFEFAYHLWAVIEHAKDLEKEEKKE